MSWTTTTAATTDSTRRHRPQAVLAVRLVVDAGGSAPLEDLVRCAAALAARCRKRISRDLSALLHEAINRVALPLMHPCQLAGWGGGPVELQARGHALSTALLVDNGRSRMPHLLLTQRAHDPWPLVGVVLERTALHGSAVEVRRRRGLKRCVWRVASSARFARGLSAHTPPSSQVKSTPVP